MSQVAGCSSARKMYEDIRAKVMRNVFHARRWSAVALALAAVLILGAAALIVQKQKFDGDLVALLRSDSMAYGRFTELQTSFRSFSSDEVLLLETDDLSQADRFEDFRDIVIELQLVPGVVGALSIFSVPDQEDGQPILRPDAQVSPSDLFARLEAASGVAGQLLSANRRMTLVILMPETSAGLSDNARAEVAKIVADFGRGAFQATFIGLPEAYRHLQTALLEDQLRLMPFAVVISLIVAGLLFRSWRAAVLCTAPPLIGLVLFMGLLAAVGLPITTMTSLVPLLILVLGITNMLHFYMTLRDASVLSMQHGVWSAWSTVAPPCALSGLTTAIAFGTFALTGFGAMQDLAFAGVIGLVLQTLVVLTLGPALAILLNLTDRLPPSPPGWLAAPLAPALRVCDKSWRIMAISCVLLGLSVLGHLWVVAGHSMHEHLLRDGEVARAETRLDGQIAGTGQRYLVLQDPDGVIGLTDDDLRALTPVVALYSDLGAALPQAGGTGTLRALEDDDDIPPVLRRFVSEDAAHYAMPLATPLVEPATDSLSRAKELDQRLVEAGFQNRAYISGLTHLAALEIPRMVTALKSGMVLTILLVTALVILIAQSLWLGFAVLVANALPVLGIEALFWMTKTPLTMTAAVALTIAFGVAVDDSLHMLNRYRIEYTRDPAQAVARSLHLVGVPIAASTVLLIACLGITQASLLPSVTTFGMIVCGSMLLAYLADIFLLPAFLHARQRLRR